MRNLPTTAAAANNKKQNKNNFITAHTKHKTKISCDGLYNSMFCCVSGYIDYELVVDFIFLPHHHLLILPLVFCFRCTCSV
jgi:hypothetical protein